MRVIYIAGTSHSGSTLLDLMLNAHPEIIAAGEVLKLNRQLAAQPSRKRSLAPCSCGAPTLWECPFWSEVDKRTRDSAGASLSDLDVQDYAPTQRGAAPNEIVFEAMAEVSGRNFIVDSSKLPKRLAYLLTLEGLDVYPIHLVRDPRGQINAVARKHGGFFKHIFRYELIHEQIRRSLRAIPHSVVHYEDLVRDPEVTLRSVLAPLGLCFDPRQLSWAEAEKHEVAGNHIRFDATSKLVLDEAWKQSLSSLQKLAIEVGTLRSRELLPKTSYVAGGR
jgi:sulfotransferase family protein